MRIENFNALLIIYFPYLLGTLFAAGIKHATLEQFVTKNLCLFLGVIMMRGAAYTRNDLADCDIDGQIARTRHRPLPRGAVSPKNAYIFTAAQEIIWLGIAFTLSKQCFYYALPLIFLCGFYAYSKRFTDFTPTILGFTIAWGVLIGSVVMDVDLCLLILEHSTKTAISLCCLYLAYAIWTNIYETVYAFQDLEGDQKIGVNSLAIRLKDSAKSFLSGLAVLMTVLLACTGFFMGASPIYSAFSCMGCATSLATMMWKVVLRKPSDCVWWFLNNTFYEGGTIVFGLLGEILMQSEAIV